MLPLQMLLNKVDNSFDSHDSKMIKSVEYTKIQEKGKFTKVFESASSENKKMKKDDLGKKPKSARGTKAETKDAPGIVEKSVEHLKQKNEKLISLRRDGSATITGRIKSKLKKVDGLKIGKKNITEIPSKSKTLEIDNLASLEVSADSNSSVKKSGDSKELSKYLVVPDAVNSLLETSVAGVSDKIKSSVLLKAVSDGKKNLSAKKNNVKKHSKAGKAKISVLDLRQTENKKHKIQQMELKTESDMNKLPADSSEQLRSDNAEDSKPIVIELTHIKDNLSSESKTMTTSSSSALMKQLEDNVNNKIVKQSSIILKEGGSGEIKLILKPEQMGKVRLRLNLTDNKITGQIIVDSSAIKHVFEQNLQNLVRAFKENGFDTAALNVSVGGDSSGGRKREQGHNITKQMELIDEIVPTMMSKSENLIDLVV